MDYVKRKFDEFNCLCFGGELPSLPMRLSNSRSAFGLFVHPRRYPASAPRGVGECHMRISTRFDLPERDVEDTIIHEMIHYYIWYRRITDTSAHGKVFRGIMTQINKAFGRNLSISRKSSGEELDTDRHYKSHYICVTTMSDGEIGVTVCARTRLFDIWRAFNESPQVREMSWYWSRSPWFNRFPTARTPRIWRLGQEDYKTRFSNATPCECDGKTFRPTRGKGRCDDRGKEPVIRVGITGGKRACVRFFGGYEEIATGRRMADGERVVLGDGCKVVYRPLDKAGFFELEDVVIGIGFHWERKETQRFHGSLSVEPDPDREGRIMVINEIPLEEYLKSVISSEMSAEASLSLLKAHAVVSRSWLLRQLMDKGRKCGQTNHGRTGGCVLPDGAEVEEVVRWYDREEHKYFDVCADDHCQRYQGITRETNVKVAEAVEATRGLALTYGGEVCDARFSKCCGGVTERFENCWEDSPKDYLEHIEDSEEGRPFCDTDDDDILCQVLNGYDRESKDFFRWEARYSSDELRGIIARKGNVDLGEITGLVPLERTLSGRIKRLLIKGSARSIVVGKELEIRRWLSESHLRSSAFTVSRDAEGHFILSGKGWGHGVGMCQIGAAVMGARGYDYRRILAHYFPKATLETIYR